jgi:predicted RNA-binding protein (virulence factor B family)
MAMAELLGRAATLPIRRFAQPGAYLAIEPRDTALEAPCVLLPSAEVPERAEIGQSVRVFLYLDSEDRPVATTRRPRLELGEVAFLEVTDVTRIGVFVNWGLPKELLVPFSEQTRELRVGERHPIGLYLDESERLAGTMRVSELLEPARGQFEQDQWLEGEVWRREPQIGVFVIVERAYVGLVPASEPHALVRGQAARFRVTNVLPDGKIELSPRARAHEELQTDAQKILDRLARGSGERIGDHSSPAEIFDLFGLSKKAFKRALGRLLKERRVRLDAAGFVVPVQSCEASTER